MSYFRRHTAPIESSWKLIAVGILAGFDPSSDQLPYRRDYQSLDSMNAQTWIGLLFMAIPIAALIIAWKVRNKYPPKRDEDYDQ